MWMRWYTVGPQTYMRIGPGGAGSSSFLLVSELWMRTVRAVIAGVGNTALPRTVESGMRIRTLALTLVAVLTGACGSADDRGGSGEATNVLRAVCGSSEGARVLTPVVEAQADGLHVELTNESAGGVDFTVERESGGGQGGAAPPGESEHVLAIGPGEWVLSCYGTGAAGPVPFELVDTGIWVSTEIEGCDTPESTHGDPPRRVTDEPAELPEHARRALADLAGLEPGYTLEPAGYPDERGAIFRARRDGRTIATMSFFPDGEGWWLEGSATVCP